MAAATALLTLDFGKALPEGESRCRRSSYWHTHGNYSDEYGNLTTRDKDPYDSNNFSPQDKKVARMMGEGKTEYKGYVGTPSGAFKGYDGKTGKTYGL